jgi:hypothetical protein
VTDWRSLLPVPLLLLSSCTTMAWDQTDWIEVGKTTRAQVVGRYGEPDLAQQAADGTIATYFPTLQFPGQPPTLPTVRTMQPSPAGFGIGMSNLDQINPRLTVRDPFGTRGPRQGVSIRYDAQDVVAGLLQE